MNPLFAIVMLMMVPPFQASLPDHPAARPAELAYQQGLYLQRTVGDLESALAAFDRALQEAAEAESAELVEQAMLRRAECFRLLGRSDEQQSVIVALGKKAAAREAALGQARYFPAESDVVLQVHLSALLAAPMLEGVRGEMKIDGAEEIMAMLGFDPLRDIERVTAAATVSDNPDMPAEHWLVLLEGRFARFAPDKVIESQKDKLGQMALRTRTVHGVQVHTVKLPLPEGGVDVMQVGLARIDDRNILAGDMRAVRSFLAARAGKAPGLRANRPLSKLGAMIPSDATFWLAATPESVLGKVRAIQQVPGIEHLPKMQGVLLTGHVGRDLTAKAVAWARDAESARLLGDVFRGLVALAQFAPAEEPLVKKLLRSLRVETGEDQVITVSVMLPGELLTQAGTTKPAAKPAGPTPQTKKLVVPRGSSLSLSLPGIERISVGEPDVASVKLTGRDVIQIRGNKVGRTTLSAKRKGHPDVHYDIQVTE